MARYIAGRVPVGAQAAQLKTERMRRRSQRALREFWAHEQDRELRALQEAHARPGWLLTSGTVGTSPLPYSFYLHNVPEPREPAPDTSWVRNEGDPPPMLMPQRVSPWREPTRRPDLALAQIRAHGPFPTLPDPSRPAEGWDDWTFWAFVGAAALVVAGVLVAYRWGLWPW